MFSQCFPRLSGESNGNIGKKKVKIVSRGVFGTVSSFNDKAFCVKIVNS